MKELKPGDNVRVVGATFKYSNTWLKTPVDLVGLRGVFVFINEDKSRVFRYVADIQGRGYVDFVREELEHYKPTKQELRLKRIKSRR